MRRLGSDANLLQRGDSEVEKASEVARIVPHESLSDIGRRIECGVIELIAKSEMSRERILGGFCLDQFHQVFAEAKSGQFL